MSLKKFKFINLNLDGGSYEINISESYSKIYKSNEVIIEIEEDIIGEGGSGQVKRGTILNCRNHPELNNKIVVLKYFRDSESMYDEQRKLLTYNLDVDNGLINIDSLATLYFVIKNKNCLVYDYGGDILVNFIKKTEHNPLIYNFKNIASIIKQLLVILFKVTNEHNNMHNDLKGENIVYVINPDNSVTIKLIDFGSSLKLDELNSGKELKFKKRININSPETIIRHLKLNNQIIPEYDSFDTNFNRWYYYPVISILAMLLCGQEYSSGPRKNSYLKKFEYFTINNLENKLFVLKNLLDTNNIKTYITSFCNKNLKTSFNYPKNIEIILNLIDLMCKPNSHDRIAESDIIKLLETIL
jgi:hypothetical protein